MANLLGRLQTLLFGAAVGRAASDAVTPQLEPVRQRAWQKNQVRVLDPTTAAEARARGVVAEADAVDDASRNGVGPDRFGVLLRLAQTFPGLGELDELSNRRLIEPTDVIEALTRHGYPGDWIGTVDNPGPLVELFQDLLDPAQLAAAIHRGLIPDPGLLKGEQPSGPRNVEQYPVYPIDAEEEAAGSGFDRKRLGVLVGLQGLPMGPHEAAQALFRGIITHGDYIAAFNQSNNRNEWAAAVLEQSRQIPTARDFIENALRGYRTFDEAVKGAELHGMERDHAELIFQNSGRAMNLHQITQALAYGAKYNPAPADDPDPYRQSTLVGPLRPEYYELNEALKYLLPGAIYFRTLQQNGVLTREQAETWYRRMGWPPELAKQVAAAYDKQKTTAAKEASASDELALYAGGRIDRAEVTRRLQALGYDLEDAGRKADVVQARYVASAKTTAIGGLHTAYKKRQIDDAEATSGLGDLAIEDWAVAGVVAAWRVERDTLPQPPSRASIKTAYRDGTMTRADALTALEELGMTAADASAFLDAPFSF